jgi:outer membrane murein-binding lipoprotein Lpp
MNRLFLRAFLIVSGGVLLAGCRSAKDEAVATVGDTSISLADFQSRLHDTPPA